MDGWDESDGIGGIEKIGEKDEIDGTGEKDWIDGIEGIEKIVEKDAIGKIDANRLN